MWNYVVWAKYGRYAVQRFDNPTAANAFAAGLNALVKDNLYTVIQEPKALASVQQETGSQE